MTKEKYKFEVKLETPEEVEAYQRILDDAFAEPISDVNIGGLRRTVYDKGREIIRHTDEIKMSLRKAVN